MKEELIYYFWKKEIRGDKRRILNFLTNVDNMSISSISKATGRSTALVGFHINGRGNAKKGIGECPGLLGLGLVDKIYNARGTSKVISITKEGRQVLDLLNSSS